jgi:AraC-like DNA-binding protein
MRLTVSSLERDGSAWAQGLDTLDDPLPAALLVYGARPGLELSLRPGLAAVVAVESGAARFSTTDCRGRINEAEVRIFSAEERATLGFGSGALLHVLVGNPAFWVVDLPSEAALFGLPLPLHYQCGRATLDLFRRGQRLEGQDRAEVRAWVEQFLAQLLAVQSPYMDLAENCAGRSLARRAILLKRLLRARLCIETCPADEINLKELSEIVGYSVPHFVRSFHQLFGVPPYHYAQGLRMQRAVDLLGEGRMSVTEVAQAVGAASHSVFARQVRAHFGCSASQLKLKLNQGRK